jgi:hypothetical protein
MFAGHSDYHEGEYLADGDIVIPAYEMTYHVGHTWYHFLWEEYTWKVSVVWKLWKLWRMSITPRYCCNIVVFFFFYIQN